MRVNKYNSGIRGEKKDTNKLRLKCTFQIFFFPFPVSEWVSEGTGKGISFNIASSKDIPFKTSFKQLLTVLIYVWVIGSQGREMKSTVMTSCLGTETAWHRSQQSHMWNCSCLWHLRLLDMGYSVITLSVWYWTSLYVAFSQNTLLFVEICPLSLRSHTAFSDKEDGCFFDNYNKNKYMAG